MNDARREMRRSQRTLKSAEVRSLITVVNLELVETVVEGELASLRSVIARRFHPTVWCRESWYKTFVFEGLKGCVTHFRILH